MRLTAFRAAFLFLLLLIFTGHSHAAVVKCGMDGDEILDVSTAGDDLEVINNVCTVKQGTYNFVNVNIFNGGTLKFEDEVIDFWAESILIENDSALIAGSPEAPIGRNGRLTIHLYGADQLVEPLEDYRMGAATKKGNKGILCKTPGGTCGVPTGIWESNMSVPVGDGNYPDSVKSDLPGGVTDYFYHYTPLPFDDGETDGQAGFFGRKVLALSYGGTLQMFGKKGASYEQTPGCDPDNPAHSCTSWGRLSTGMVRTPGAENDNTRLRGGRAGRRTHEGLQPGDKVLVTDHIMDWEPGDRFVVTTTDYLPGHSEEFTVVSNNGQQIDFVSDEPDGGAKYFHNGELFDLGDLPERLGIDARNAETRAAVGLLTRSIRIVSEGDTFNPGEQDNFPPEPGNFFGGHTIVRQGFEQYQIQGVEFHRLGQGGRMGHYPVHFHKARKTPENTFIKDSSINESMTRWVTIHGTQGVLLARNVGFKSIGHGFYFEDAVEIDNRLYSNLGVFARAAVDNIQNPRQVPGILAQRQVDGNGKAYIDTGGSLTRVQSDYAEPTVFWITNTWNDLQYNMAAGAGTCGACYWPIPAIISGPSTKQRWDSYASLQRNPPNIGTAPIKKFVGNYCSSAMNSINTSGDTSSCHGLGLNPTDQNPLLVPVYNPLVPAPAMPPAPPPSWTDISYFPRVTSGSFKTGTRCDADSTGARVTTDSDGNVEVDCTFVPTCSSVGNSASKECMINAIDRYTSSFHWAETNFGAMWLRGSQWYLVLNSILTDVQNGGLSIVTGGDYTESSAINGHWGLIRKTVFVGNTEDQNPFASNGGPFVEHGLSCDGNAGNNCLSVDEGINMQLSNFGMNQRLFNIYDGPSFQDSNAYLDINTREIDNCQLNTTGAASQSCFDSSSMYGRVLGVPADEDGVCHMPNAAIGWKQPNGFYYPPAFHSENLFFDDVDIRHFVIEPLFEDGTLVQDNDAVRARYCTFSDAMFSAAFTDVDRQTVLNDDDGSLTGLVETISVNEDPFFNAPVETDECKSGSPATAKTSPYEYITTVIYPECAIGTTNSDPAAEECFSPARWSKACSNGACYGVPMYRQFLTKTEWAQDPKPTPGIRLMGSSLYQRSSLTANHGKYYIDTTVSEAVQKSNPTAGTLGTTPKINVFTGGQTYYLFTLFAKASTEQTYQMYVGKDNNADFGRTNVKMTRVDPKKVPFTFTTKDWPANWPDADYNADTGILTVTMNLSGIQAEIDTAKKDQCLPSSACKWENSSCVTSLKEGEYLYDEFVEGNICENAVKAVDCPDGGCYGVAVTLPDNFTLPPPDGDPRPATEPFPENDDWNVNWKFADSDLAGDCTNPVIPLDRLLRPFPFFGFSDNDNTSDDAPMVVEDKNELQRVIRRTNYQERGSLELFRP